MPTTILNPLANGRVGGALTEALLALAANDASLALRLGARTPARTAPPAGVAVLPFDYERPDLVARALHGVDAVFLAAPSDHADVAPILRAVELAEAAGVRRVVLLSAHGVDFRPHPMQALEARVRAGAGAWTVLRPNTFMQNYAAGPAAAGIRDRRTVLEPAADGRSAFVDVRDIAAVAARALADPRGAHDGRTYQLTGPAALDRHAVARHLGAALGEPVTYVDVAPDAFAAMLAEAHVPPPLVAMLGDFYDDIRRQRMADVTDDVERVTGRPATPFARFATDHVPAWGPTPSRAMTAAVVA